MISGMNDRAARLFASVLAESAPGQVIDLHRQWCLTRTEMTDRCTCIPLELRVGAQA